MTKPTTEYEKRLDEARALIKEIESSLDAHSEARALLKKIESDPDAHSEAQRAVLKKIESDLDVVIEMLSEVARIVR